MLQNGKTILRPRIEHIRDLEWGGYKHQRTYKSPDNKP